MSLSSPSLYLAAIERGARLVAFERDLGDPEEIGAAMAFFACDEACWITGQILVVDGGQTLPEG